MILSEIDRLTATTQRLLESARPADDSRQLAEPDRVIQKLLGILGHLARQYGVEIQSDLNASEAVVASTEATLSEIFFNLIKNAIEACQNSSTPRVIIRTRIVSGFLDADVIDNGAGISPELQNSLFQPFVTGKPQGTGLGLYIVSERVRELRGSISCRTETGNGTTFELRLPLKND
jgi:signal transduction histidine kinase